MGILGHLNKCGKDVMLVIHLWLSSAWCLLSCFPPPHLHSVVGDGCASLSLVLPQFSSCSKGAFSSRCRQVLAHQGVI